MYVINTNTFFEIFVDLKTNSEGVQSKLESS